MRHLAWLNASFEDGAMQSKNNSAPRYIKRKDYLEKKDPNDPYLQLEDVGIANYILKIFYETGIYRDGANGIVPLTWQEISAFDERMNYCLDAWESKMIFMLSNAYCNENSKAKDKNCPPPVLIEVEEEYEAKKRESVSSSLKNFAKMFMKNRGRKNGRR